MRRFIVSFLILSSFPLAALYAQVNKNILDDKTDSNKTNKNKSTKIIWSHVIDENHTNNGNLRWEEFDEKED